MGAKMTYPSFQDSAFLYFVTATVIGWKPLFKEKEFRSIVFGSMSWLRKNERIYLFAFVLMPTHIHFIIKPRNVEISEILQQFGSYTAHAIIRQLERNDRKKLLMYFHKNRRPCVEGCSIWQDIQAQAIVDESTLSTKLEYIHNNPVNKGYRLVKNRQDYRFSSACFYDCGKEPFIAVDHVWEWLADRC